VLYKGRQEIAFDHRDLVVGVAAGSKLMRIKVRLALEDRIAYLFETTEMTELLEFVTTLEPAVLILGFRFFSQDSFPGDLLTLPNRPKIILTGTREDLERHIPTKGVDALLCHPFLADMLLLRINSVLEPDKPWTNEKAHVLAMMRKYQRFRVETVQVVFQRPVFERTRAIDMSFQGLKALTEHLDASHVGETFQMEIVSEGAYLLCHGVVTWVREGTVGVRFARPKPPEFSDFFLRVVAQATDLDD